MSITLYLMIYSFLTIGILLYLSLFSTILQFKWNIDYFKTRDSICVDNFLNKMEIETYRYNIYAFLYDVYLYSYINSENNNANKYSFKNIKNDYLTKYYLFIGYIIISFLVLGALFLFNIILFTPSLYILLIIIFYAYIYTNGIIVHNFNKLQDMLNNKSSALYRYNIIYKILNAIILISNPENIKVEYSYHKFNKNNKTFEEILEDNIASYENISNTSKIKQIRKNLYNNLDFMKYMVLNTISPLYWTYLDNPYIRIPGERTVVYSVSENIYLNELFDKRNSYIDYDNISIEFSKITELIKGNTNNIYSFLYNKLYNEYPNVNDYKTINEYYLEIYNIISSNTLLESYNKVLYDKITDCLHNIEGFLRNQQYKGVYSYINELIHNKIHEKEYNDIQIPNNDYIEYFINNRDIILNTDIDVKIDFEDIFNTTNDTSKYIYIYSIFSIFIYFTTTHYFYKKLNGYNYILLMSSLIILYISYGYLQNSRSSI